MEKKTIGFDLSDKDSNPIDLSPEEKLRMRESLRNILQEREAREKEAKRRLHMTITAEAGLCVCCGFIQYTSSFTFIATGPVVFGGRQNGYHKETVTCSCKSCGLLYDPKNGRFDAARDYVRERRLPPEKEG